MFESFTFETEAQYNKAYRIVLAIGVDFEADPQTLTIITDELSPTEYRRICAVYNA